MSTDSLLSFDNILTLAEHESGAYGLADEGLRQRVGIVVDWINARGPYSSDELRAMQPQIRRLLANRLKLALDRQRYPAIAEEAIERPIFIIGFARSGTTLIHSLLAEDPEALAPQSWHIYSPSPPPGAGPVVSGRIAYAQRMVEDWMDFCPAQKPLHPYIDKGAFQLCEDEEIYTLDFRYTYPYHYYRVPTMDTPVPLEFDPLGAFRFQREFMQHLQWNTGKKRWACKGPNHQGSLAALFEVYPDALCVWAHRPVGEIYPSISALSAAIYQTITGRSSDIKAGAKWIAEGMRGGFDRVLADEMIDDPRILHFSFREIAADPLGVVRRIYDRQGLQVSDEFASRVTAWLASPENEVDRYGRYPYSYETLGLERKWVEDLFADYSKRFGLD